METIAKIFLVLAVCLGTAYGMGRIVPTSQGIAITLYGIGFSWLFLATTGAGILAFSKIK